MGQLVYICGALTSDNEYELQQNINAAQMAYRSVLMMGHDPVCTFLNDHNFTYNSDVPYRIWLNNAIRIMLKCDSILLTKNVNNQHSKGVLTELYYASEANIPVYLDSSELPYIETYEVKDLRLPDNFDSTFEQLLRKVRR